MTDYQMKLLLVGFGSFLVANLAVWGMFAGWLWWKGLL